MGERSPKQRLVKEFLKNQRLEFTRNQLGKDREAVSRSGSRSIATYNTAKTYNSA